MAKYVVDHSKLYLRVNGKTQLCERGTNVDLTEKQAKALGKKVISPKTARSVKADAKGEK